MYDNLNRLLYFETDFLPDYKIQNELINMHHQIRTAYKNIDSEENCGYQRMIRKQTLANYIRSRWVLIKDSDLDEQHKDNDQLPVQDSNL